MSNIYLNVAIETFSKLEFSEFKKFVTKPDLEGSNIGQLSLNFKTSCCNLKIRGLVFFYYFNFERSYDVLKSKSPCILLNKNINFNKKRNGMKNGKSDTQF